MKEFFKMFFASVLGVITAGVILICISLFITFALIASIASKAGGGEIPKIEANSILHIDNGSFPEIVATNPWSFIDQKDQTVSLSQAVEAIKLAKNNPNISGIYLDIDDLAVGMASAEELRRALQNFKSSGKFIVAYADRYSQKSYYLSSIADQLYLNPKGMLGLTGIASQTMFYKDALEKFGVKMEIFKVGTYKAAVEPFMLSEMSEANREQITTYINGLWNKITSDIAESRKTVADSVKMFADNGDMFNLTERAVEMKLVDRLAYRTDVETELKKLTDRKEKDKLRLVSLSQVLAGSPAQKEKENRIAVLFAEGEITEEVIKRPFDTSISITQSLARQIKEAADDDDIKAVVLRVNSPGGSAFTSEQIWKQVVDLKTKKPIVVSMGDVAASGGYYIACAANAIVAERTTLTGSIGIFGMFPNFAGVAKKLGVNMNVVQTSKHADLGNFALPMTADDRAIIQRYIEQGYDIFLTRVSEGRNRSKSQIDSIAQGRVWLGEKALEIGLVDELGGLETAIKRAATLAELGDNYYVKYGKTKRNFLEEFLSSSSAEMKTAIMQAFLSKSEFEALRTIQSVPMQPTGVQARLPYSFIPY